MYCVHRATLFQRNYTARLPILPSVVDRYRVDADSDPDQTLNFDADPDPDQDWHTDSHADPTPSFTHI
jgi:hypothetical protein